VELWIDAAVAGAPPTAAALSQTRKRVGADAIRVLDDGRVELSRAEVVVDLGGIAKGYALDGMVPLLRARGIGSALLSFGQSSSVAIGAPAESAGWRLLARGPAEEILGVLTLRDQALSVSSSFGQWLEIGEDRYGHVIDPRSGRPLSRKLQALIVAPDATLAEALSKALLILPPDEGLALVTAQPDCEGMLVDEAGATRETPGWQRATRWAPGLPDSR
jgi:thiamine biosynthesis lipoprotein